jgi:Na+-translocating ferredoxin:NAD+ oxidoreductase RnfG subunit
MHSLLLSEVLGFLCSLALRTLPQPAVWKTLTRGLSGGQWQRHQGLDCTLHRPLRLPWGETQMDTSVARWLWLPTAVVSTSVYATTYLTVEQAQQAIFPGARLVESFVTLTDAQQRAIEQKSGVRVISKEIKAWQVAGGGLFMVDQVIGKHEFITFALGLNADGSIRQIEVLAYRESYGYEVRNPIWRRQFVGKTLADALALDHDIKNISGATLSCRHLTEGVKRLVATHEIAFK